MGDAVAVLARRQGERSPPPACPSIALALPLRSTTRRQRIKEALASLAAADARYRGANEGNRSATLAGYHAAFEAYARVWTACRDEQEEVHRKRGLW